MKAFHSNDCSQSTTGDQSSCSSAVCVVHKPLTELCHILQVEKKLNQEKYVYNRGLVKVNSDMALQQ